jgi:hypothetical protein
MPQQNLSGVAAVTWKLKEKYAAKYLIQFSASNDIVQRDFTGVKTKLKRSLLINYVVANVVKVFFHLKGH